MADENRDDNQTSGQTGSAEQDKSSGQQETGDSGRTPGKAEGDEATVEESLRQKES